MSGRSALRQAPLVALLPLLAAQVTAGATVVALVEPASIYQQAARGFQESFRSNSHQLQVIQLNSDARERDARLAELHQSRPDLVIAIGAQVARTARQQLPPEVPILYCLALSPRQNGLAGPNVGGIALDVEVSKQFSGIQRALPKARLIGVIYNELNSGALVREARRYLHNGVRLIGQPVSTPQEAARAIPDMLGKVSGFWLLWDPVILNPANFRLLVDYSLKNRVALIAPGTPFVESGALMTVRADYFRAGRRASEMALEVLDGRRRAADFNAEPPQDPVLTINEAVARRLGLKIPADLGAEILSPGGERQRP